MPTKGAAPVTVTARDLASGARVRFDGDVLLLAAGAAGGHEQVAGQGAKGALLRGQGVTGGGPAAGLVGRGPVVDRVHHRPQADDVHPLARLALAVLAIVLTGWLVAKTWRARPANSVQRRVALVAGLVCLAVNAADKPPVNIILWFDTEDYVLPADDDACKRLARPGSSVT